MTGARARAPRLNAPLSERDEFMKKLAFAALLALSGCGAMFPIEPVGRPVAPGILWRCDAGHSFRANVGSSGAHVHAGGRDYALPHVQAQGARYAGGGVEYWERAGSATLTGAPGGPYQNCRH
jgi:hypothetical protein